MGFFRRIFGSDGQEPTTQTMRVMVADEMRASVDEHDSLVEVDVVGEGFRQDALAQIAGPKTVDGKREHVGVVLRCEPTNPHDPNAVRVETMGQLVGYLPRHLAEKMQPAILSHCGGVLEARGIIVGGWSTGERDERGRYIERDEGHYGIRVWITTRDAERLGMRPDEIDTSLQARWPKPPPLAANERRLTPLGDDPTDVSAAVTVTCEEHYQPTIVASMPANWNPERTWPVLCDLAVAPVNPHSKHTEPSIEVRIGTATVGYFTPKMTVRHSDAVWACDHAGMRATAMATVSHGTKGGVVIYRVKVFMPT